MQEKNTSNTEVAPPHVQLVQMATAYWVTDIVYVVAELGPGRSPRRGAEECRRTCRANWDPRPSLYRLMGTLANLGILTENAPRRFALTPLGDALRIGAPGSVRATILTLANDWHWRGL
jgi:hypothetical protein